MGTRAIRSATNKLVNLGLISAKVRGRQETKKYTVHYDELLALYEESRAGRDEFIVAQHDKKTVVCQCAEAPSQSESDSALRAKVTVLQSESDSALRAKGTVLQSTPNYVSELCKETKEKELEQKQISGAQDSHSRQGTDAITAENIQKLESEFAKLESEVADLISRKRRALSEGRPVEYSTVTNQLHERQMQLSRASGSIFKAAQALVAARTVRAQ